jgi:hypothetical protein
VDRRVSLLFCASRKTDANAQNRDQFKESGLVDGQLPPQPPAMARQPLPVTRRRSFSRRGWEGHLMKRDVWMLAASIAWCALVASAMMLMTFAH